MSGTSAPIIRFSTFEVNLRTGELRQNGLKVRIQEQPFQVLAALLERPGELVTREELRKRLWSADTFVDFDHGLNAAVKRLRDALGESADAPLFIETMARRGYRFVAPIHNLLKPIEKDLAAAPERSKVFFLGHWIAAALLFVVALGVAVWYAWRPSARPAQVIERRLTANSSENSVRSAAISGDGKYLAYADNTGVYLKLTRTGETHPVPLPANFSADVNDWFPDGSHLLVTREEESRKFSMWSISIFGGSPRLLADDGRAGCVSPDGSRIAFQRRDFGREEWIMRLDGTEQVKIAGDQSSWVGHPTWSPDGGRIAYIRAVQTYHAQASSIEINDWRNSKARTFLSGNRLGPSLLWLPNGLFAYTTGDEENQLDTSLWTVSPQQSEKIAEASKRITRGIGWISQVSGSRDGKTLALLRENTFLSIYIGKLSPDGMHLIENKRITLDENQNDPFAWTPDSKAVLFHSDRNGATDIFKQAVDQPLAESMVSTGDQLLQPRVSPEGSEILYISNPKSGGSPSSIFAVPMSGGSPRLILRDPNIWNLQCPSSPRTQCMYSIIKGETSETYRFDVKTGKTSDPPQVDPISNWSLSPDGRLRAIVAAASKGTIRLRSALTGETHELHVKGWDEFHSITWSADGKTLLVGSSNESDTALLRVALDGSISVLFRSTNPRILGSVPSPDGRWLAIATVSTTRNVWQIENF